MALDNFLVEWHTTLDKGRINLPRQCRQEYSNGCVLQYFPDDGSITGSVRHLGTEKYPPTTPYKVYLDSRGRLLIPAELRRAAGITGPAVIVAIEGLFEIRSEEAYQFHLKSCSDEYGDREFVLDWPKLIPSPDTHCQTLNP